MKYLSRVGILAGLLLIAAASCKKKEEPKPAVTTPSAKEMVVGTWKLVKEAIDDNNNAKPDEAERKDRAAGTSLILELRADGTGKTTVANGSVTAETASSWTLADNDKTFVLVEDQDTMYCPVYSLTASEFIIEAADNEPGYPKEWLILNKQ